MGPLGAVKSCYSKLLTFSGRASRSEFWWFMVFQILFGAALAGGFIAYLMTIPNLTQMAKQGVLPMAALVPQMAFFFGAQLLLIGLPGLSVMVRRLHDTNRSGWWYFISFVPVIGGIWPGTS